ncbi:MAG: hypothetical protein IAG10_27660, partial [Planctomycetaceae bacterium]|nr:hypothetical protein [Planctomycetaceae bacterium]
MNRLPALLAVLILLTPLSAVGEEELWNIRIEMQVVAVPEELAVPLVAELMDEAKAEPAYAKIQELLAKGVATLLGWPMVTTKSGQRAVVEAIDEIRFATGYSPPTINFRSNVSTTEPVKIEPRADVTLFEGIPSSFETRNA